ncbi:hypothetical protein Vadar_014739 [Vaccinium darrowii]|uniref:Uncharacterized protein n=1 Tax=Vaccinium darrowii TaxID=229202 RepID=A0ACB7YMV6_9ERIC|nr:hypothetical protein Vadar_014739 [Vaccinium darrowii]
MSEVILLFGFISLLDYIGTGVWGTRDAFASGDVYVVCDLLVVFKITLTVPLVSGGRLAIDTTGGNLNPHALKVQVGEDIIGKLLSVIHMGPQTACIFSTAGSVAIADIHTPGYLGSGVLRCEA